MIRSSRLVHGLLGILLLAACSSGGGGGAEAAAFSTGDLADLVLPEKDAPDELELRRSTPATAHTAGDPELQGELATFSPVGGWLARFAADDFSEPDDELNAVQLFSRADVFADDAARQAAQDADLVPGDWEEDGDAETIEGLGTSASIARYTTEAGWVDDEAHISVIEWSRGNVLFSLSAIGGEDEIEDDALEELARGIDEEAKTLEGGDVPEPFSLPSFDGEGDEVYSTDFSSGWDAFSSLDPYAYSQAADGGGWVMHARGSDVTTFFFDVPDEDEDELEELEDAAASVTFEFTDTHTGGYAGLMCRQSSDAESVRYVAEVADDGFVYVLERTGDDEELILTVEADEVYEDGENDLRFACVNGEFDGDPIVGLQVTLNDEIVAEAFDMTDPFEAGRMGLYAEASGSTVAPDVAEIIYTDFSIEELSGSSDEDEDDSSPSPDEESSTPDDEQS